MIVGTLMVAGNHRSHLFHAVHHKNEKEPPDGCTRSGEQQHQGLIIFGQKYGQECQKRLKEEK